MKKLFLLLMGSLMLVIIAACGANGESEEGNDEDGEDGNADSGDGETISWSLGHINNEEHVWHQTAERFAELVNEKSDGQIEIELHPNEELGGETDMINSIQQGSLDLTISGETLENWAPKAAMMAAPYALQDSEHMSEVVEGDIGAEISEEITEQAGLIPLYYHERDPRNLTSNEPINTPEDLNGFDMRVPNVPLFMSSWEAAGANPQVMDLGEVFTGIQQGVIDGQENPMDLIYDSSFYEVQEYVNKTEHVVSWIYVVVGEEQYNSLSDDLQTAVDEAAAEAQEYGQEIFEENSAEIESQIEEAGMTINEDVDQEAFQEAMQSGVEENLSEEQLDLYERIQDSAE